MVGATRMNNKKFFYLTITLLVLSFIGLFGLAYYCNRYLVKKSDEVVTLKLKNVELSEQQQAYQALKVNVDKYSYVEDILNSALPKEKDQAKTAREIFQLAEESNIRLAAIQYPASTLAVPATPTDNSTSSTGNTVKTDPAKNISQAEPVSGLNGVYAIKATITPIIDKDNPVTYDKLISYLDKLESNRRALQVTDVEVSPLGKSGESNAISFTITIKIFIKP